MKKIISSFLAIVITITCVLCVPISAYAYDGEFTIVDDLYKSGDFSVFEGKRLKSAQWIEQASSELRNAMVLRKNTCEINVDLDLQTVSNLRENMDAIFAGATSQESSVCTVDGDYIRWQISSCGAKYSYNTYSGSYRMTFSLSYYTTYEEEIMVNNAINQYLSSLDMSNLTDYELLLKFHDYIISICEYNYDDMENDHNYSAYGVFCNGKAVCQGYALAFYRLCREAGIDACFVCSDPNIGCHAWNLVHLGDAYYYVDCTWDDDDSSNMYYDYFLVDYNTLRKYDSPSEATHTIYEKVHNNDYFNNRYRSHASPVCYDNNRKSLSNCTISVNPYNCYDVTVKYNGAVLTNGVDYTVSPSTECFALVTGLGDYSGTYSTECLSIRGMNPVQSTAKTYSGAPILPDVSIGNLKYGTDFAVLSTDNISVGTKNTAIVGTGSYTGVCYSQFTISPFDISFANARLSYTETYYDGTQKYPAVFVDGLKEVRDYTVSYNTPNAVGTGHVTITGVNNCKGRVVLDYTVLKRNISEKNIQLSEYRYKYNGYAKKPVVYIPGLVEGQDYKVSYKNNVNVGTAWAIITGINCYTGTAQIKFEIYKSSSSASSSSAKKPKKASIKKLKTSKKAITVYWKKMSNVKGYQIQYSTKKSFKKAKTITVNSKKASSKKIAKLKKGKKYYIRVRAFKKSGGKKLCGAWSAKKSITCK